MKKNNRFRKLLEKYLEIKGLDIVVVLDDGTEIELYKNRQLIDDMIITMDNYQNKQQIPLSRIKSVDMFAA
ncbi:MAG TPA: hypothetical protein PKX79_06365 [Spirochaetota bacterium]|jgi:hypothetical protein|nr:hypothetical protein [Spirochaetota bacterium]OQA97850.1 MAG: hypothetical protein BWY23_01347 [Spirochaetes bacterium ADurb.Bin218]HOK01266.1 hypothetical protein [Spirochaetota bacterium]HOK92886.1 hypothetical protein [Spirochaetota bacterium]HON16350.1 hypothetical protein [Spirochaetota bacterium]